MLHQFVCAHARPPSPESEARRALGEATRPPTTSHDLPYLEDQEPLPVLHAGPTVVSVAVVQPNPPSLGNAV